MFINFYDDIVSYLVSNNAFVYLQSIITTVNY